MAGLVSLIRASRQRKRERFAEERAYLSEQEQREFDRLCEEHSLGLADIHPDRSFGNRPGT
jgi:hypothetical protein